MQTWFVYSIIAFVLWGLWGFFAKVASGHIDARSLLFWEMVTAGLVALIPLLWGWRPNMEWKGASLGALVGLFVVLGHVFFYMAFDKGKASVVMAITALYPVVTLFLVFFLLKEEVSALNAIGIVLALVAMPLMAI